MRCHSLAIHPTNRKETDPESREFLGTNVQGGHVAGALSILPIGIATIVSIWLACRCLQMNGDFESQLMLRFRGINGRSNERG